MPVKDFFNVELEPEKLEHNFRAETLSNDKVLVKKVVILILLVIIGFIIFDFNYLQKTPLYISLISRLFTVIISVLFIFMVPRLIVVKAFDRNPILWGMVLVSHMLIVAAVRPGDYVTIVSYDIIVILGSYIAFPIPLRFQFVLAGFLTAGSVMLWVICKTPPWGNLEIVATLSAYFIANILGIFVSAKFNRLHRNQFVQVKQELQTRKELESEIIDRKQTQEALLESEKLFIQITEHTSALVSIHDANGNYIFASISHERLGYKPKDLIGQSGFAMIKEEDIGTLLEYLDKAKQGKVSKANINYRLKSKNGETHNFRGSFDSVYKSDGSLERIVCVGEDITELTKAQVQREEALSSAAEAKKLALIGQVAGKMAHDFNNILGVIMGLSEISKMDCKDEKITKNLELIFDQTLWGKNLTKNLVAFARSQEPMQEVFKIKEATDLVLNLMGKELENTRVIIDHNPRVPHLLADQGMVQHTLVNLLQNAVHATSKKENPKVIIKTYCRNNNICVEIEDNGCGIPKEHLVNIYEPSFSLKGSGDKLGAYKSNIKGTGYGLANIKKYIEQHNGKIQVESTVNAGTKFTISIPLIKKELSVEEKTKILMETNHSEKYILLVEDEQAISDVQYRILTQDPCNHKVDTANNGRAAIDLLNKNQYDFVSLDYVLPGDINGKNIYDHIRETNKEIPILFISGNIEFLESIKDLKQQDQLVEHLSKPCKNIDYVNGINKLLSKLTIEGRPA